MPFATHNHDPCSPFLPTTSRAAHNGHLNVVEYLLASGAAIEAKDLVGVPAQCLMVATPAYGLSRPFVAYAAFAADELACLSVSAPTVPLGIPRPTQGDNTALHWAAMRGHVEVVRALVVAGADKAVRNRQGSSPLDLCDPQVRCTQLRPSWTPCYDLD